MDSDDEFCYEEVPVDDDPVPPGKTLIVIPANVRKIQK